VSEPAVSLDDLVRELKDTAGRLRSGDVASEEAAALVDRCAELAAGIASELDRQVRDLEAESSDQETLL